MLGVTHRAPHAGCAPVEPCCLGLSRVPVCPVPIMQPDPLPVTQGSPGKGPLAAGDAFCSGMPTALCWEGLQRDVQLLRLHKGLFGTVSQEGLTTPKAETQEKLREPGTPSVAGPWSRHGGHTADLAAALPRVTQRGRGQRGPGKAASPVKELSWCRRCSRGRWRPLPHRRL